MYDNSKQLMNDFMGGYTDDQYTNFVTIGKGAKKMAHYRGKS